MDTTTSAGTAPSDAAARYAALLRVSKTLAEHHSIAELFAVLADQLHTVVPFDYLALVLHNPQTDEMELALVEPRAVPNPPRDRVPVSELGPSATVFTTQKALVIPIPSEGQLPEMLAFIRAIGRQVSCWLPLTTTHRRLGVLSFGSCLADTYGPGEIAFMEQVAAHVAVAVDNSINFDRSQRLKRELTIERDRLRLLLDISNLLVDTHDLPSLLKATSDALRSAVKHQRASLVLTDRESHEPTVSLTYDERGGVVQATTADGAGFDAVHDATADTPHDDCHPIVTRLASEAMCRVPLSTARSGTLGALDIVASGADALGPPDVELLAHAAPQIAIAVENAVAFGDMAARYDRLIDEKAYLEDEIRAQGAFGDIIGTSASLRRALAAIKTVAPTDATVLLLGETGTGKELAARAIHEISKRRGGPFIRLSGAAIPTTLLESELFGSEKGAFTGAVASRAGRLELADGGTLFLDEVGDLAPEIQPKLLRVLQEREFERLGSTRTRRVDVRIVAATNRDLDAMVESETFREDLFYRLSVFPIRLPPLRERTRDVPALARYFAERSARRMGRPVPNIPPDVMHALVDWRWPGNIRELENVIERAVILSSNGELRVPVHELQIGTATRATRANTLRDVERKRILAALRESHGVVAGPSGAAERLGVKRTTLQSMMRRLGIRRPSF